MSAYYELVSSRNVSRLFAYKRSMASQQDRRLVYISFLFRDVWHCLFLDSDIQTALPRLVNFGENKRLFVNLNSYSSPLCGAALLTLRSVPLPAGSGGVGALMNQGTTEAARQDQPRQPLLDLLRRVVQGTPDCLLTKLPRH